MSLLPRVLWRVLSNPRVPWRMRVRLISLCHAANAEPITTALDGGSIYFIDPSRSGVEFPDSWQADPHLQRQWNAGMHAMLMHVLSPEDCRAMLVQRAERQMPGMQLEAVEQERAHLRSVIANIIDSTNWR